MAYRITIDELNRDQWMRYAADFADYSVYQTWAYQEVRGEMDGQEVSRVLIRNESEHPILMGTVRIKRIPVLGLRIGYVQWGPLVRIVDGELRCTIEALDALRKAYLGTMVDVLRIAPNVPKGDMGRQIQAMLSASSFQRVTDEPLYRTFALWVGDSEEGILRRLRKSFRRDVRYGEKAGVEIREGCDTEFWDILQNLYESAKGRKGFKGVDLQQFLKIQPMLSANEKLKLMVAYHEQEPVAVHLASNLGDTSVVLIVACNEKALSCFASYVLWYRGAVSACQDGMKWCDLGGVDPKRNPNVYQFKSRMGPEDTCHIGTFEAYANTWAKLVWYLPARLYSLTKSR